MPQLLDALFGSSTRSAILATLLLRPDEEFHLRRLQREVGFNLRAVNKEVDRLTDAGVLLDRRSGNRRYVRANTAHSFYEPLRELLARTAGVIPSLRDALADAPGIDTALVFGSVAAGAERPDSDVDLLIVGAVTLSEILERLRPVETALNREINPIVMTTDEFERRREAEESTPGARPCRATAHCSLGGTRPGRRTSR